MRRVTPRDRDRAIRRLTTTTSTITAGSIVLTGVFMALAKYESDARTTFQTQQKAELAAEYPASTPSPTTRRSSPTDSGDKAGVDAAGGESDPTVKVYVYQDENDTGQGKRVVKVYVYPDDSCCDAGLPTGSPIWTTTVEPPDKVPTPSHATDLPHTSLPHTSLPTSRSTTSQ
jgi:hypothetical protein